MRTVHEHAAPPPERRPVTIMVVEDDDDVREAVVLLLEAQDYTIEAHSNALDALAALRGGALPDVILLDLNMPEMDGWEFRVQQKRDPSWASIPVIAISADSSAKAAAIDAHAYMTKPVEPQELLDTIGRLLTTLERERLHERAKELERLSSLGVLAGGIAHEINNPLSFVLGNVQLAERKLLELEQRLNGAEAFSVVGIRQVLTRAKRGAERISSVVGSVAMFARADTDELMAVDVRELLDTTLQLASNEIRHAAKLERAFEPVPVVLASRAKLGRVFLNLLLNAVHATSAKLSGDHVIRVATSVGSNRDVVVSISDTGPGIPPELMPRIFDPFFALSPAGSSTGLGLGLTRELVNDLGGSVSVESSERGSTFRVALPSRNLPILETTGTQGATAARVRRKRPRILVIDDEPMLCQLLRDTLISEYEVETCNTPQAGLDMLLADSFDVILCDLMMPEITGIDVYEKLLEQRPEQARGMIFITGGVFTDRARKFLATTRRPQVRKPFRHEELIDAIEALLSPKSVPPASV